MEDRKNESHMICDPTDHRCSQVSRPEKGKWATSRAGLGSRSGAETTRLIHKEKIIKVATWNVGTMYQAGKLTNAVKEMKIIIKI